MTETLRHQIDRERSLRDPAKIEFNARLAGYGRWTYRAAWGLEIVAAIIGLATGIVLGYQASVAQDSGVNAELALASAPFFMVALAELTKIPIATLLYLSSWKWRPVLLIFLIGLAGITFQTVFMGLERAATLRQLQIEQLTEKAAVLRSEKLNIESELAKAETTTSVDSALASIEQLNLQAATEQRAISDQIAEIDKELESQNALTPEAAREGETITTLQQRREETASQQETELRTAVDQFERQRDSYVKRMEGASDPKLKGQWADELRKLVNPRPAIIAKHKPILDGLDTAIAQHQAAYDRLVQVAAPELQLQRQRLTERKNELNRRLDAINAESAKALDEAKKRLADEEARQASRREHTDELKRRLSKNGEELSALEAERIPMARQDQIRRIAGRFFGKYPEDVSIEEADRVALVWFGSLALLAALAGPLTAIVALGLQKIAAQDDKQRESKLARLMRRVLLNWRWRRVRTVKVFVEVPVEKQVEKRIEIPVEVEKLIQEILYVPILTDDPEALRKALREGVSSEVADLVHLSINGQRHAG